MDPLNGNNVKAFLLTVRKSEGTDGPDGYRMMFGGKLFESFADHPKQYFTYTDKSGKTIKTSAAGAYQIVYHVWFYLENRYELTDFTPASQDKAAIDLISERNALDDIIAGRFETAIQKVRTIWASLPGADYNQPEHSLEDVKEWYLQAGGTIAA